MTIQVLFEVVVFEHIFYRKSVNKSKTQLSVQLQAMFV